MAEDSKKDKILIAARELFVAGGYAGTSIGKIAKRAGINHSLIFHHFGNKENLWLAVKMSIVEKAEQYEAVIPPLSLTFDEFIKKSFHNLLHFYKSHPDIVRMINWQRLELNDETLSRSQGYMRWVKAVEHYQKTGEMNKKIRADFVVSLLLSAVCTLGIDRHVVLSSSTDELAYIDFCINSIIKATAL